MYTVGEGAMVFVDDGVAERIWVAAFPINLPAPVNQTLSNPVPPPRIIRTDPTGLYKCHQDIQDKENCND